MDKLVQKLRVVFDLEGSGRLLLYSALVGVVSGLGAAAFYVALSAFQALALGRVMGYYPPGAGSEPAAHAVQMPVHWWAVLLVPALGGLACGWLVYTFAPEAEGHGTDAMVRAFHRAKGLIRARVPLIKTIASTVTIGTGGSAGREGPIAQIGAGFGSFLAGRLRLSDADRRMLVLAGAAGGVGAIFHAPVGGALFAVEVLYASTAIEFSAFVPCVCSSVIAYSVFNAFIGPSVPFRAPAPLVFRGLGDLPFYLVFAVLCALVGFAYVWTFYNMRQRLFRRLPLPNVVKPALGGLLLGALALELPQVMAGGYGWIQQALDGKLTLQLMAMLAGAKIVATSLTISSGGSGGVFAPSLFIGAMLGGAFGMSCHALFPDWAPQPQAFVLVGMGGFFAGVAKVPLTALIMVSEMTGSYSLLVPLMVVSMINVAILSRRWTLYEEQVSSLVDSPAHLGDFVVDVLAGIRVREIYNPARPVTFVREETPLPEVLKLVARSNDSYFPVVDRDDALVGIFSLHDIRTALVGNGAGNLIVAADLATWPVATVTPDDNLHTALRLFTRKQIAAIPVVDPNAPRRVVCMLHRGEVIDAYDQRIQARRQTNTPADPANTGRRASSMKSPK
ncbi:MAG: chloride channel protein [Pirellulales bacterium]|nr:chloride channel protein [Pirellulales bacterium]